MGRARLVLTEKIRGNVGLRLPDGDVLFFHVDYEHDLRQIRDALNAARDILAQVGILSPSQIRELARAAGLLEVDDG